MSNSRAQLTTLMNSNIITGGRQTTAMLLRNYESQIIAGLVNINDDFNQPNGYMGLDANGFVDITHIAKITPTGQFLRDDGTWETIVGVQDTLAQTLSYGNSTGANNIVISTGAHINFTDPTPSTVAVFSGTLQLTNANTTITEINYVSGVTSAIQTQLNSKAPNILTGYVQGAGTVGATDSVLQAIQKLSGNIALVSGALVFTGLWNANTNSPTLTSGAGTSGSVYKVSVAGTTTLDGISQWNVGDQLYFSSVTGVWQKLDGTATEVLSVNGLVGAVALTGTAGQIDISGSNVFSIDSGYVGQTSITTLGTITTGVWHGTSIGDAYISSATNWNTAYTNRITTFTTTGSSGAATLSANTLNIPNYTLSGLGGTTLAAVNAQNLSVFATGGAIAPATVNGNTITTGTGTLTLSTFTLTVAATASISGTNTGDQTNISGNAATVTTNANLTGVITSVGNATSIASQTGTGTKFVVDTSPTLVTPVIGAASGTSLVLSSFLNEAQGANIASAATTNIGAATGNYVNITGTTTITAFDSVQAGTRRILNFNGALTLTYNATSLILPGAANITTVAGDCATFVSLGSGNWQCVDYSKVSQTGTGSTVLATSPTFTTNITTPQITGVSGSLAFTNATVATGAVTNFVFTPIGHTGQTASTNIPTLKVASVTQTWAAGTLATQYFNSFQDNTIAFASASTATDSYNTYIGTVVAGTNATLTRKYSLGTSDNVAFGISNASANLYLGVAPGGSNMALSNAAGAGSMYLNAPTSGFVVLSVGLSNRMQVNNSNIALTPGAAASGATATFALIQPNNTGRTASTEVNGLKYTAGTQTWATNGTVATQREWYLISPTYATVGTTTITNSYTFYAEAPTAGTGVTITNNWAIGCYGSLKILNSGILQLGNAYTSVVNATVVAALNKTIVLYDSNGVAVTVPCY